MNLLAHQEHCDETVPSDIAKRIVSHAISPVVSITSSIGLDNRISETYNIDSLYMLLRFFGGCVSDRDQANEARCMRDTNNNLILSAPIMKTRRRSNSLFQRDSTQSQYIRFTRPISDIIESKEENDMLFDHHSLEAYVQNYLRLIHKYTSRDIPHKLLKKSLYHCFFSLAISSTTTLSPYESFNHPIVSLIALDYVGGEGYENARDLLSEFKNLPHSMGNFPAFMSTSDILPVFLICYSSDSPEQLEGCKELAGKIKKQLLVDSLLLPLWDSTFEMDEYVKLHQPVMSSLEEMIYFTQREREENILPLRLINDIYNMLNSLVYELLIPFMQRKIAYWSSTMMQPRKSIFHGPKWVKRFVSKNAHQTPNMIDDERGNRYFISSSIEFSLRKLADWSMMLSDFKTAYETYTSLTQDFNDFPKYLASCHEWNAISILMGAQNIVTVKMIKNDIDPTIGKALDAYDTCATRDASRKTRRGPGGAAPSSEPFRSYETRCMILCAELFLSLRDTWTATPYAIDYLETLLYECKLGPCSQILIWERLSDCYELRIDPRIRHKVENPEKSKNDSYPPSSIEGPDASNIAREEEQSLTASLAECNNIASQSHDISTEGLTRKRKSAFFRLIAAKKWAQQKQWRQAGWCLDDIKSVYSQLEFAKRDSLIYRRLNAQVAEKESGKP